jgi:hypothetical protein
VFDLDKPDEDDVPGLDSWSSLILIMIYEYLQGDKSQWKSYFDVLPSSFDTPMFWSENELDQLQASHMRHKIGKADAENMFKKTLVPIIRSNPSIFSAENKSDEELIEIAHRMGSTIMAYAFDLENDVEEEEETDGWVEDRDGKSMMGMVPMADILNADAEFNVRGSCGLLTKLTDLGARQPRGRQSYCYQLETHQGRRRNSQLLWTSPQLRAAKKIRIRH